MAVGQSDGTVATAEAAVGTGNGAGTDKTPTATPRPTQRRSLAFSLPVELIELVINNMDCEDVVLAAAHLPQLWREVIRDSFELRNKLRYLHNFKDSDSILRESEIPALPFWFSSSLEHGTLVVQYIKPGWEGQIFVPYSNNARLRILDPATQVVEFRRNAQRQGAVYVQFFDLERGFVCERVINDNTPDALWRYATKVKDLRLTSTGMSNSAPMHKTYWGQVRAGSWWRTLCGRGV